MMSYLGQQLPRLSSRSEVTHAVLSGLEVTQAVLSVRGYLGCLIRFRGYLTVLSGPKFTQAFIYRGQRLPRLSSGSEVT